MRTASLRVTPLLLAIVLLVQPCVPAFSGAPVAEKPVDSPRAAAALALQAGGDALDDLQASQRASSQRKRLGGIFTAALLVGLGIGGLAIAGELAAVPEVFAVSVAPGLYAAGMAMVLAGGSMAWTVEAADRAYQEALVAAGADYGWYVDRGIRIAPAETLAFARNVRDPGQRGKVLAAVLAASARFAPETAEPTCQALVATLRARPGHRDNVPTMVTALRASEALGPEHPAVAAGLRYLEEGMGNVDARRPSAEAQLAASTLAFFRPQAAQALSARFANAAHRSSVWLAAAEGAVRWGQLSDPLLARARSETTSITEKGARAEAEIQMAASPAAASVRSELAAEAVDLIKTVRPGREATRLTRELVVALAPADLELALSLRSADDRPLRDLTFSRALAIAALRTAPTGAHAVLVQDLPQRKELTGEFGQLAGLLASSADPATQRAGREAAQAALVLAPTVPPEVGYPAGLMGLQVLASSSPELAQRSLPVGPPQLIALCRLRLARVLALEAATESDPQRRQAGIVRARQLLRDGLAAADAPRSDAGLYITLAEVSSAVTAVAVVDPAGARAAADAAVSGPAKAEALTACGVTEALTDSATANQTLSRAVEEAGALRDRELREALTARALAGLWLTDPANAQGRISKLSAPWARAAVWTMRATLTDDPARPEALSALHEAADEAAACRDPEHRVRSLGWVLNTTVTPAGASRERLHSSGLPWFVP